LHAKALVQDARPILSTDEIWAHSTEQREGKVRVRILPPAWQLLFGVLHHQVGDRGYRRRVLALKGLWEFAMETRDLSESDWQMIVRHTRSKGGHDALLEWITLAGKLFGLAPPDAVRPGAADRSRAAATLRWAGRPASLRRALFFADTLLFAFSKERLAMRYGCKPRGLMLTVRLRHLLFLLNRHGRLQLRRIFARQGRRT
jgi:hypothetical protein